LVAGWFLGWLAAWLDGLGGWLGGWLAGWLVAVAGKDIPMSPDDALLTEAALQELLRSPSP